MIQTQTLFQAVKHFVNSIPKGQTFTTKEYLNEVGEYETITNWKKFNQNLHYRSHTYKSYLKRVGFLTNVKKGTWRVDNHIPPSVTLGTVEFLLGYNYDKSLYNGISKERWKNVIKSFNEYFKPITIESPKKTEPFAEGFLNDLYNILQKSPIPTDLPNERYEIKSTKDVTYSFQEGIERVKEWVLKCSKGFEDDIKGEIQNVGNICGDDYFYEVKTYINMIEEEKEQVNTIFKKLDGIKCSIHSVLDAFDDTMYYDEDKILMLMLNLDSLKEI